MNNRISIIYPTRNRPEQLKQSLQALLQNTLLPLEIIIVDQSTNDATESVIKNMAHPLLRHVRSDLTGLSRARNSGIQASRGDVLGFLDDDCIPAENWLAASVEASAQDSASSVWIGEVYNDAARISKAAIATTPVKSLSLMGKNDPWRLGPTGGNSFFRKQVFTQVGLFDPDLGQGGTFPGAEDGDMIYRVLKHGLQVTFTDTIRAYHTDWRNEADEIQNAYNHGLGVGAMLAKYLMQGDLYPCLVIFPRNFLFRYPAIAYHFFRSNAVRMKISINWAKSILLGFIGWYRNHR